MKLSKGFKRSIAYAVYDCAARGKREITVDHLLLGLYREDFPLIDDVTKTFAVDSFKLLDYLILRNPESPMPTNQAHVCFGSDALDVLKCSELEAYHFAHDAIRPEHLFLGLLDHQTSSLNTFLEDKEVVCALVRELVAVTRFGEENPAAREVYMLDPKTRMEIQHFHMGGSLFNRDDMSIAVLQLFKGY
jgi:ATP-dependent Clp protease ATP-binding subunit ClpA